jgi:hypothetical protein
MILTLATRANDTFLGEEPARLGVEGADCVALGVRGLEWFVLL